LFEMFFAFALQNPLLSQAPCHITADYFYKAERQ